jgi:serine/threonine-protein kinase
MGAVYKVLQPVTGRMAALKLLRPSDVLEELVGTEELARRFYEEARIMGQLEHPHVAAVLDADHDARNRPFFLMEYYCLNLGMLIGESYRVEAPTRRLPLDRAVRYARQTLEALRRMHYAGIVHRDVKPYNT